MAEPEPIASSILLTCATCGDVGEEGSSIECPQCHDIRYCDQGCCDVDKSVHDLLCGSLTDFKPANAPSPTHGRAILFPDNDTKPRFVWVNRLRHDYWDSKDILGSHIDSHSIRKFEDQTCPSVNIRTQAIYLIYVNQKYKDKYEYDGNASIEALSDTKGKAYDWKGPVLAVGYADHVNMRDFRAIVDHLQAFPKNNTLMDETRHAGQIWPAIKLNTARDMETFDVSLTQPVALSRAMVLDRKSYPFSLLSGLKPQIWWRHAGAIHWDSVNRHGLIIYVETQLPDLASEDMGGKSGADETTVIELTRLERVMDVGQHWSQSYVIFRKETGPIIQRIQSFHIEAIEAFIMEKARLVVTPDGYVRRNKLVPELTMKAFAKFWDKYKAEHKPGKDIKSPFPRKRDLFSTCTQL